MHLIIAKDKEDIRRVLDGLLKDVKVPVMSFYPENFSIEAFFQEVETVPFLSQEKAIVVHEIDRLEERAQEMICKYVDKPNSWIVLYLTANELSPQHSLIKLVEKKGKLHRFKEEKPWEKEKRLVEWLIALAQQKGMRLSSAAALMLVQRVDHHMLASELEKLVCFAFQKKEITQEDISLLTEPVHHETLWHLGEAILSQQPRSALAIGRSLFEDGISIFPILGSLRSQFAMGMDLLLNGQEAAKKFPYLKGNFLEKKLQIYKKYGLCRLQQGILLIFDTELNAKNSATDPSLLLEILTLKLTYDSLSTSQFIGAC